MVYLAPNQKGPKWFAFVIGGFLLGSVAFLFLPFLLTQDEFGHDIALPFWRICIGGSFVFESLEANSSFYFRTNYPLFVVLQLPLLSAVSSFAGFRNRKLLWASAGFLGLALIGFSLSCVFVSWINPSLPLSSLRFGVGLWLLIGFYAFLFVGLLALAIVRQKEEH